MERRHMVLLSEESRLELESLAKKGFLKALCIMISSDAAAGNLMGRMVETECLELMQTTYLGHLENLLDVFGFGLEADVLQTPMFLSLKKVGPFEGQQEINMSYFFQVRLAHDTLQKKQAAS